MARSLRQTHCRSVVFGLCVSLSRSMAERRQTSYILSRILGEICLVVSTNKFPDLYLSHATSGDNGIITAPTGLQHVTQMEERGLHIEHGTVDIHLRHSSTVDWPSFAITPVCRNSLGWLPDVQWCHCSSCGPHLVLQALDGVAARTTTADSTRVLARFREDIILRYW